MFTPFLQLEQRDVAASQTLRAALCKAEASHPGFSYDLVLGLVRKSGDTGIPVNMNESLLRLQGAVSDQDSEYSIWDTKYSHHHVWLYLLRFWVWDWEIFRRSKHHPWKKSHPADIVLRVPVTTMRRTTIFWYVFILLLSHFFPSLVEMLWIDLTIYVKHTIVLSLARIYWRS